MFEYFLAVRGISSRNDSLIDRQSSTEYYTSGNRDSLINIVNLYAWKIPTEFKYKSKINEKIINTKARNGSSF